MTFKSCKSGGSLIKLECIYIKLLHSLQQRGCNEFLRNISNNGTVVGVKLVLTLASLTITLAITLAALTTLATLATLATLTITLATLTMNLLNVKGNIHLKASNENLSSLRADNR